jgi:threonine synthase
MGLNVDQFIVGSNKNDILTRFLETGSMIINEVHSTLSPSMDIQVSSNFERLLFEILEHDGDRVQIIMDEFRNKGQFSIDNKNLEIIQTMFYGARFDDEETKKTIYEIYEETGELIDPHTAVGIAAGRAQRRDKSVPLIALATAHPAKFPKAVDVSINHKLALPNQLANLSDKEERFVVLANDLELIRSHISENSKTNT